MLKVQKGFAINQEEAEKNMKHDMSKYATTISAALSSNKPSQDGGLAGINLDGPSGNFKTNVQGGGGQINSNTGNLDDLLDMGGGDEVPQSFKVDASPSPLNNMQDLNDILGGG